MESIEDGFSPWFLDFYGHNIMSQPQKKHQRRKDSAETEESTTTVDVSLPESINNKLANLELLHQDFKEFEVKSRI